ncbi:hypothetical protein [Streptomyces sp. NPDC048462]|uniref:hypothetical protein n=1 Tax=Streptomyces sp. NPDC048462 TaxID=3365555 RepID=UPI0037171EB5
MSGAPNGPYLGLGLTGGARLTVLGPVRITHGPAAPFRSGSLRLMSSSGHHLSVPGR